MRDPLKLVEGEEVANVRIVISPHVAQLTGRILAPDGKTPQRGVGVVLIPGDPAEDKFRSRMSAVTNADGRFRVTGAPGEYVVLVVRREENPYQLTSEVLRQRTTGAQRIVLQPDENRTLELTMQPDP